MDTTQLTLLRQPFDDSNFLFELKHDGFRALAHVWDGHCELISRRRNSYKSFQNLRDSLGKLKVQNAVIDGELVCLDAEGRSIFNELLFRRRKAMVTIGYRLWAEASSHERSRNPIKPMLNAPSDAEIAGNQ